LQPRPGLERNTISTQETTSKTGDGKGEWPESLPGYIIEEPYADLLGEEIDYGANILGNLWLERQSYAVIQGTSGIGKSMLAVQLGLEAALGRETFGLRVDRPLRVLVLQAEDSRNDRIRQVGCLPRLAKTRAEEELIKANFRVLTPERRPHRGADLFEFLADRFERFPFDLLILNPAFAFVDGSINDSSAVGEFLRSHLHEFLHRKNASAIVVHHVPKPPKSGRGRASDTTMYSGHGSAEWANAPRASITVSRTAAPWVFLFEIGKRGSYSGWTRDGDGYYSRYFTHSRLDPMFWAAADERDVAAAMTGVSVGDFASIFSGEGPFNFAHLRERFRHFYNYSDEELEEILAKLVEEGRLIETEEGGETVWRPCKKAKGTTRSEASYAVWVEEVFLAVREAGPDGINVNRLRNGGFSFRGNNVLDRCLRELVAAGRIVKRIDGRYAVVQEALLPG